MVKWNVQIEVVDRKAAALVKAVELLDPQALVGERTIMVTVAADNAQAACEYVDAHLIEQGVMRSTAIASVAECTTTTDDELAS